MSLTAGHVSANAPEIAELVRDTTIKTHRAKPPRWLTALPAGIVRIVRRLSDGQMPSSILRNRLGKDSHLRQTEVSVTKGFQFEREGSRTWRLIRVVVLFQIKVADTVSF